MITLYLCLCMLLNMLKCVAFISNLWINFYKHCPKCVHLYDVINKSQRHFWFTNAVYLNNFDVKLNSTQFHLMYKFLFWKYFWSTPGVEILRALNKVKKKLKRMISVTSRAKQCIQVLILSLLAWKIIVIMNRREYVFMKYWSRLQKVT